jgi:hypothetical protein
MNFLFLFNFKKTSESNFGKRNQDRHSEKENCEIGNHFRVFLPFELFIAVTSYYTSPTS